MRGLVIAMGSTIYRIDGDDRFVYVNDEWHRFAAENEGSQSLRDILGKSIWDCFADRETEEIFRLLLQRVRTFGTTVDISFRCDGPAVRRYMRMTILPRRFRNVSFVCTVEKEDEKSVVLPLSFGSSPGASCLKMCSLCNKLQVNDQWLEVEDAVNAAGLMLQVEPPRLTSGVCPVCHDKAWTLANGA